MPVGFPRVVNYREDDLKMPFSGCESSPSPPSVKPSLETAPPFTSDFRVSVSSHWPQCIKHSHRSIGAAFCIIVVQRGCSLGPLIFQLSLWESKMYHLHSKIDFYFPKEVHKKINNFPGGKIGKNSTQGNLLKEKRNKSWKEQSNLNIQIHIVLPSPLKREGTLKAHLEQLHKKVTESSPCGPLASLSIKAHVLSIAVLLATGNMHYQCLTNCISKRLLHNKLPQINWT